MFFVFYFEEFFVVFVYILNMTKLLFTLSPVRKLFTIRMNSDDKQSVIQTSRQYKTCNKLLE